MGKEEGKQAEAGTKMVALFFFAVSFPFISK